MTTRPQSNSEQTLEPYWAEFLKRWNDRYPTTPLYDTEAAKFYVQRAVGFILTDSIDVGGPVVWPTRVSANVVTPTVGQKPINMILFCPRCGTQHVDAAEDETSFRHRMEVFGLVAEPQDGFPTRWTNPPHKSHLCHQCGAVWRPADVPTNGVAQIKTRGERDNTWTNSVAVPAASTVAPVEQSESETCPVCKNDMPINSLLSYQNIPNAICRACAGEESAAAPSAATYDHEPDIYDAVIEFRTRDGGCALCGHNDLDADGVTCAAPIPICSDPSHGLRHCGCRCVFRATTEEGAG